MDTGDTITVTHCQRSLYYFDSLDIRADAVMGIPDGKDTAGLGEVRLLLNTTDPLFEDGRYLGRGGLVGGSIAADLLAGGVEDNRRSTGLDAMKNRQCSALQKSSSPIKRNHPTITTKLN